ncbi:unnamed protein product, partial [Prorocentrum cordatum]
MLAQKWDMKLDPAGWWMSEKLDGVRGYWDGKNFYSRLGNQFPAPDWFKEGLPSTPLDGELWCGRRQFRRCLSIVRNRSSGKLWEYITFLVFDAPSMRAPYEERVAFIKSSVSTDACRYAAPVGIVKCSGREHLSSELKLVDSKGGEGIMLRQAGSAYEHQRSKVLRKVKSVHDEEAKIVGHEGGRGRAGFHCGALTLETPRPIPGRPPLLLRLRPLGRGPARPAGGGHRGDLPLHGAHAREEQAACARTCSGPFPDSCRRAGSLGRRSARGPRAVWPRRRQTTGRASSGGSTASCTRTRRWRACWRRGPRACPRPPPRSPRPARARRGATP